ncbi:N-formylglutamate amidohydrolase [Pontibacter chitinilyticus]|uniref:N-formylglutamate amidohydrolase n=1 Tax=Pontibacter chitinilyticus TaxID=2674989 RepID=UPI00321B51C8
MPVTYLLTCEHAGNEIPATYAPLFKGHEAVLYSHKALDLGALDLAQAVAAETGLPLYVTTISRLLVEANRSPDHQALFSEYTNSLPAAEKYTLLHTYYFPHRRQVETAIAAAIATGRQVCQIAVHTFTPVLDGNVRQADIGILFDPARALEVTFAQQLEEKLLALNPARQVLYNSPYAGTDDGLPTYLRKKFPAAAYAGLELEINQKFFLSGRPEVWQALKAELAAAVKALSDAPTIL